MPRPNTDTIAALATPSGRGGIGIIRVSGKEVPALMMKLVGFTPHPRVATFTTFRDQQDQVIDQGLIVYFPAPNSFTGEDVVELQGHGGPIIMDCLLQRMLQLGARLARPGEFSERAFLNDKLDLAQAEAIADLIDASSAQAARAAIRSLQGEFSQKIRQLTTTLIDLRIYVEAAIDFPEEEVDFLKETAVRAQVSQLLQQIQAIQATAQQGVLLRDGMTVVIAGPPNAGKSTLLNALSGRDLAIVTDVPGTTRDVLRSAIQIDGLPLHVIDTAGLRQSVDPVEQEGIRRALQEIETADQILLLRDVNQAFDPITIFPVSFLNQIKKKVTTINNKIDLCGGSPLAELTPEGMEISLSAKTGEGMNLLREHLKTCMGFQASQEGNFIARRRHLDALRQAEEAVQNGLTQLINSQAGELLAEDLRQAQYALNEITGEFTADDLLGKIFSSFCLGK